MSETLINIGIIVAYILIALAALTAIIFPLIYQIKNPKEAIGTLIGIGFILVVLLISYLFSSSEVIMDATGRIRADESTSKLAGAGIIALYILFAGAILSIVYTEVSQLLKR